MTVRGLLLFLTSKTAQATQHVQSALRLDPGHEAAMRLRKRIKDVERLKEEGNVAFKTGKLLDAADKYAEALERIGADPREGEGGPLRAMLLSNRATTLVKLGRHDDALADTEASLVLNPTSFKALRTRARIQLHLENYDAAVADFKSAIEQAGIEGSDADVRALRAELKKAEVALKRSKTKDYYKILGVERECTEVEIRKAYRRESLKHHPDKVRCLSWSDSSYYPGFTRHPLQGRRRGEVQARCRGARRPLRSAKAATVRHGRGRGRGNGHGRHGARRRPIRAVCPVPRCKFRWARRWRLLVIRWRGFRARLRWLWVRRRRIRGWRSV